MTLISVIILTRDEEKNLPFALSSLRDLDVQIYVVDSGSVDATCDIARAAGATVVQHAFVTQAQQLNWALDTLIIDSEWVMRIDADERLMPELVAELKNALPSFSQDVTGLMLKRRVYFWNRWIRYGGYYPTWLLRIWRNGAARCEDRDMDEHMIVTRGSIRRLDHDIIDENHKGIAFWTDKHNRFSDREVRALHRAESAVSGGNVGTPTARKRFLKNQVYGRAPKFLRAFAYWAFRYFALLGFLDGKAGFVFHFLQAFWYRILVDAKLYEIERSKAKSETSGAGRPVPTKTI